MIKNIPTEVSTDAILALFDAEHGPDSIQGASVLKGQSWFKLRWDKHLANFEQDRQTLYFDRHIQNLTTLEESSVHHTILFQYVPDSKEEEIMSAKSTEQTISTDIRLIDPRLMDPNRYQPKTRLTFTPEQLADLESVKTEGLIHKPRVCVSPDDPNRFMTIVGWRRRAAWMYFRPGEPIPVEVVKLEDRGVFDEMIIENAQRLGLSMVEQAQVLKEYMRRYGATQAEAGKLFGWKQDTVSNKLKALRLPTEVQQLNVEGKLAEVPLRVLATIAKVVSPKQLIEIAQKAAADDDPTVFIDDQKETLVWKNGRHLEDAAFKLAWPPKPLPLAKPIDEDLTQLIACTNCEWRIKDNMRKEGVCVRPACFDIKQRIALDEMVPQLADKLGIPLAGANEKAQPLYSGGKLGDIDSWNSKSQAARLVKARLPELRIVPCADDDRNQYDRENVLGSRWIALAATDVKAVMKWVKANKEERAEKVKEVRAEEREVETEAQKRKRLQRERNEEIARRAERSAFNKEKHDVLWLLAHTAPIVAEQIQVSGPEFLRSVVDELDDNRHVSGEYFGEMNQHIEALDNQIEAMTARDEKARLLKERMVYVVLSAAIADGYRKPEEVYQFDDACEEIKSICTEEWESDGEVRFGVKLPSDWNKPPIHHTPYNCWHCGTFAPGDHLTKRDVEEFGWIEGQVEIHNEDGSVDTSAGDWPGEGVFCVEEHAAKYEAESAKAKSARPRNTKTAKATKTKRAKKAKRAAK